MDTVTHRHPDPRRIPDSDIRESTFTPENFGADHIEATSVPDQDLRALSTGYTTDAHILALGAPSRSSYTLGCLGHWDVSGGDDSSNAIDIGLDPAIS